MKKGIFITGVGTDVGKTYASALLVKKLRKIGIYTGYFKPVLSGAMVNTQESKVVLGDVDYVCKTAGIKEDVHMLNSYYFTQAVSPHLAAEMNNQIIKIESIMNDFKKLSAVYDFIVVEGCGGLFCPICTEFGHELMLTDIMKGLDLSALLVTNSDVGTLHSTVLTAMYAQKKQIDLKGIIMNNCDVDNIVHMDNWKQIEFFTKLSVLGSIARNGNEIHIFDEYLEYLWQ